MSRRLSKGSHPHIVGVLDYEIFDDPFSGQELYGLVMELVEGVSLANYLARRREANKPLKVNEVLGIMSAVCAALEHAHGQGVYHRDLKPHNVMVAKGPVVKLMDFGIARVLDDSNESPTRSGQVVGTLAYLPPELLGGRGVVDARTDVYMAGTLLLELLTGDPSGRADCPAGWVELIAASTSRMRGHRPASVVEFRAGLKQQEVRPASDPVQPAAPPVVVEPAKIAGPVPVKPATAPPAPRPQPVAPLQLVRGPVGIAVLGILVLIGALIIWKPDGRLVGNALVVLLGAVLGEVVTGVIAQLSARILCGQRLPVIVSGILRLVGAVVGGYLLWAAWAVGR